MSGERGSVTLWMVGLVMVVLAVGGIAVDLWRGLAAHRHVAAVVDAAAIAAGSGIDERAWREDGRLVLEPARVAQAVAASVAVQSPTPAVDVSVDTAGDGSQATVTGATTVDLTLLGLFVDGDLEVSARATASPSLSP